MENDLKGEDDDHENDDVPFSFAAVQEKSISVFALKFITATID